MNRVIKISILLFVSVSQLSFSQSIISWTEQNGVLGLGYPVPIPIDTSEPFGGFRTYAGLFAKHQMIEQENPYVSGHIVGQTRKDRDIWAYVLSDENNFTKYGVKEGVMMANGNIHAREWQSPEVLTGIIELLHEQSDDQSLHQFLLENTTIITVPVNNVDGLLQTQRYPEDNWYHSQIGPRDGRMRRKNMLFTDEILLSEADFLQGVDLNRNNSPYWDTSSGSSGNPASIVYHGSSPHSEPETLARLNAADLASADQFRSYTDVHSFSLVHFSERTSNNNRNLLQRSLLSDFSTHHAAFEAGKNYVDSPSVAGSGIGTTAEYFANTYEVPSWTLEIEPSGNGGADYGGFHRNGHDGFILPESQIRRVREELASTFMVAWYGQAGPPSITQIRVLDKGSKTIVYDAEWDVQSDGVSRELYQNVIDNLIPGREYQILLRFDKPMRNRDENGTVTSLQGQVNSPADSTSLNPIITAQIDDTTVQLSQSNPEWINQKSTEFKSYGFYKDDTFVTDFSIPEDVVLSENSEINWSIDTNDMVNQKIDANPATAVTWFNGQWRNYENELGNESIIGGADNNYSTPVAHESFNLHEPIVQNTGLYFDPTRSGEGFSYELLSADGNVWMQWFTYDENGDQRWYSDLDNFTGNVMTFNAINAGQGGVFGEAFDTNNITYSSYGDVEFIFSGGVDRATPIGLHTILRTAAMKFTDTDGKKLRTTLHQLSLLKDNPSDISFLNNPEPPVSVYGNSSYSGSWYAIGRGGEGYIIEVLENDQVVLLFYTYDLEGNHMWLIDSGGTISDTETGVRLDFNSVLLTQGPQFGPSFDTNDLENIPWGELHFDLTCNDGTVTYDSLLEGYGQGSLDIVKLTSPINLFSCE